MFVALQLEHSRNKGIVKRIAGLFARPEPTVEERICRGARYAVVHAHCTRGPLDWTGIAGVAGRYAGQFLLPTGLSPPPDSPVRPVACAGFQRKVLLHTACEIVKRTRMPMYRRIAGLIDPEGDFTDWLSPLLHHYTTVRVVTANHLVYARAADAVMEELGAPVLVGGPELSLENCVLAVIPGDIRADIRPSCPVLAPDSYRAPPGCEIITGLEAEVLPDIRALCPAGIAPHHFAAALHDCCGIDVEQYVAERLQCNYRTASLSDAVHLVMRHNDMQNAI